MAVIKILFNKKCNAVFVHRRFASVNGLINFPNWTIQCVAFSCVFELERYHTIKDFLAIYKSYITLRL